MGSFYTNSNPNSENISNEYIYFVHCSQCKVVLSQRGCLIYLASDLKTKAYSTDTFVSAVIESTDFQKYQTCSCLFKKAFCKNCKNYCACHLIYRCTFCEEQPNNGHQWIFLNSQGSITETKWAQLQPSQKPKFAFFDILKAIGVSDGTLEILKKQEIASAKQLHQLSDVMLKQAGISLGQLALLRYLK